MCSLGKTLLAFALLHSVLQGQIHLLLQVFLDFLHLHSRPLAACGFLCPHREVLITHTFNITVIHVYAPTSNTEEANVERFYEDLKDLLELTPQNNVPFIIGDQNAKVGVKRYLE